MLKKSYIYKFQSLIPKIKLHMCIIQHFKFLMILLNRFILETKSLYPIKIGQKYDQVKENKNIHNHNDNGHILIVISISALQD